MPDDDNRVIGSEILPSIGLPADALAALSTFWIAAKRLVIPYYELVISEQRLPDTWYASGYRSREYSAIPHFAIVNTQPQTAHLYVSFAGFDGGVQLDMAYEGSLQQRKSVEFNVADHTKIAIPKLKAGDTEGDLFWVRQGWIDIHASLEVQVDAWINYYQKPMLELSGHHWTRTLPVQESSHIRKDAWFPKKDSQIGPMQPVP